MFFDNDNFDIDNTDVLPTADEDPTVNNTEDRIDEELLNDIISVLAED